MKMSELSVLLSIYFTTAVTFNQLMRHDNLCCNIQVLELFCKRLVDIRRKMIKERRSLIEKCQNSPFFVDISIVIFVAYCLEP